MTIRLIAKGPIKSVKRAAARHGVPVKCRNYGGQINPPYRGQRNEVACDAPCTSSTKVHHWYGERSSTKRGRGHTPGTLLYFTAQQCTTFGGAGRRRRKR
jgi:hypothetical protein